MTAVGGYVLDLDNVTISTKPGELREGLFGQVLLYVFEILPYVEQQNSWPNWNITSKLYGAAPDYRVLPGVFELAYIPPETTAATQTVRLEELRAQHCSALGNDWHELHRLWSKFFAVPPAITEQANQVAVGPKTLGLHYRGRDKNTTPADTNRLSHQDFIYLAKSYLEEHSGFTNIYLATDEIEILEKVQESFRIPVVNLGAVEFHKSPTPSTQQASRALLDVVLLSRCGAVLKGASALSGFAKILNPDLEISRMSASKMFADIPYFPDAYIPRLTSNDPIAIEIIDRQMKGDWLDDAAAVEMFGHKFRSCPRTAKAPSLGRRIKYKLTRQN